MLANLWQLIYGKGSYSRCEQIGCYRIGSSLCKFILLSSCFNQGRKNPVAVQRLQQALLKNTRSLVIMIDCVLLRFSFIFFFKGTCTRLLTDTESQSSRSTSLDLHVKSIYLALLKSRNTFYILYIFSLNQRQFNSI